MQLILLYEWSMVKKKSLTESFDVFKTYLFNNFKNGHAQAASEHAISINDVFLLFAF